MQNVLVYVDEKSAVVLMPPPQLYSLSKLKLLHHETEGVIAVVTNGSSEPQY